MSFFKNSMAVCPVDQHCSEWARKYMSYCLCCTRDGVSLSLGLISVLSWGVAEIPQIVTNYKEKSTEGLSLAFLVTWLIGDLFNVFGCMLEPATLPTQYYMAMLYTITTFALTAQTIYFGHIYPRLKCNADKEDSKPNKTDMCKKLKYSNEHDTHKLNGCDPVNSSGNFGRSNGFSAPISLPSIPLKIPTARELYYVSARSLSSSHTPTSGSILAQRNSPTLPRVTDSLEEPLLGQPVSTLSAPALKIKTTLCLVSSVTFLIAFNLQQSAYSKLKPAFSNTKEGVVIPVGRKLLQASDLLQSSTGGSSEIGSFLGWAMAAIYMGGRLPQICLNMRRGNVEGLNPLMFIFALVGNTTYVGSILVSSLDWSRVQPNLPWLVDAAGCVLLDTFILIQFVYFRCPTPQHPDTKEEHCNAD